MGSLSSYHNTIRKRGIYPVLPHGSGRLAGMIASDASLISYLYLFQVAALIFAVCVPLLLLLPKDGRS